MVQKFAVVVNNFSFSQLSSYITYNINSLLMNRQDIYTPVFYENLMPVSYKLLFPLMHVSEAFEFDGPIISTSLSTAFKICNFPCANPRYFYVWDLEWIRLKNKQYQILEQIYRNPLLTIIARSDDHAKIIEESWNVTVHDIMADFNFNKILSL